MTTYRIKPDQLAIRDFPEITTQLGIDTSKLGVVMLDLYPPEELKEIRKTVPDHALYVSDDPNKFWMNGWVAGDTPHISLRYGLLEKAPVWKEVIDLALEGWSIHEVEIESVTDFDTADTDPAYIIVAKIKVDPNLLEGHERLGFLPHINTFTKYKQHMTIAYIDKNMGDKFKNELVSTLNKALKGKKMEVKPKLNLGSTQ